MSTASRPEDPSVVLERFRREGISDKDKVLFMDAVNAFLSSYSTDGSGNFEENISKTAEAVGGINKIFNEISEMFNADTFNASTGSIGNIVVFFQYGNEWRGYITTWKQNLDSSYETAQANVNALNRFDTIYLQKVENIKTEQDRIAAMDALKEFIDSYQEDHADTTSRGFHDLKRDIANYIPRFCDWIYTLGLFPSIIVSVYQSLIASTLREIQELDRQIEQVNQGLSISGDFLIFVNAGDAFSSLLLMMLQAQRNEKLNTLRSLQMIVNMYQQLPILKLQARLQSAQPDFDLLFDRMVMIAEIWSSARSQAVQFRAHIAGGLEAATNTRFKSEVKLARSVCTPLKDGLTKLVAAIS